MDTLPSQPVSQTPTQTSSASMSQAETSPSFPDVTHVAQDQSGSLIRALPVKHRPAYVLWFLTLIALGASGYAVYLATTLTQAMTAYQQSLTQWSGQVTALQSSLTALTAQVATLPTVLPTPTSQVTVPTDSKLPFVIPSSLLSPSTFPTSSDLRDDAIDLPSSTATSDSAMTAVPTSTSDTSISSGRLTAEDETAMLNSYLSEIQKGDKKTIQPDGLTLVKNRQSTADSMINYDVFKSKSSDDLYIYARKSSQNTSEFADGWYGPFAAFPGA